MLMGEDSVSNGSVMMGTKEGKAAIAAEKGGPSPTMPKLKAGAEDSFIAPGQFTVPVATTPNH